MSRGGSTRAWRATRAAVLERDRFVCQLRLAGCTTWATEVDHIQPWSRGGTDQPDNLRAACRWCNRSRGAGRHRRPITWLIPPFFVLTRTLTCLCVLFLSRTGPETPHTRKGHNGQ